MGNTLLVVVSWELNGGELYHFHIKLEQLVWISCFPEAAAVSKLRLSWW
jgi:hypothetical protein